MSISYKGKLYRALNPIYACEPMSGRGAELHGGRFNSKGAPALYLSLSVMTALREANQVGNLQPTTLVSYEAEIENIFDSQDDIALNSVGIDSIMLAAATWRDEMRTQGESKTQTFARQLSEAGYNGLLVRSFAPGANANDVNLVLWRWGRTSPFRLVLIDDEQRLSRPTL